MTLRTRRTLFYSLIFLFILVGAGVVLYSRGWKASVTDCRFKIKDLKVCKIKITKTGAIFIETKPKDVIIKIDGEVVRDKSGLLRSGTLITELLPKTYKVEIEKDGYHPWRKNLPVLPEAVAEAVNIILVPKIIEKEGFPVPRLRGDELVAWSDDGGKFIIRDSKSKNYYLYALSDLTAVLNINAAFGNLRPADSIGKIAFHPFDSGRLIVETETGLYVLDTGRVKIEIPVKPRPVNWTANGASLYYIRQIEDLRLKIKDYELVAFNLIVKTGNALTNFGLAQTGADKIAAIGVSADQTKIAYLDNLDDLYIYDRNQNSIKKIAHNAEFFKFSPDNKKLAFLDRDKKLNILFLEDWSSNNPKKTGDVAQFILEEQPTGIEWYEDALHLLISHPDKLRFMEIDDREPTNIYPLAEKISNNFYYSKRENLIYFLEGDGLYRLAIDRR